MARQKNYSSENDEVKEAAPKRRGRPRKAAASSAGRGRSTVRELPVQQDLFDKDQEDKRISSRRVKEILGVILIALGLICLLGVFGFSIGALDGVTKLMLFGFGWGSAIPSIYLMVQGYHLVVDHHGMGFNKTTIGWTLLLFSLLMAFHAYMIPPDREILPESLMQGGGVVAGLGLMVLRRLVGVNGAIVAIGAIVICSILLATKLSLGRGIENTQRQAGRGAAKAKTAATAAAGYMSEKGGQVIDNVHERVDAYREERARRAAEQAERDRIAAQEAAEMAKRKAFDLDKRNEYDELVGNAHGVQNTGADKAKASSAAIAAATAVNGNAAVAGAAIGTGTGVNGAAGNSAATAAKAERVIGNIPSFMEKGVSVPKPGKANAWGAGNARAAANAQIYNRAVDGAVEAQAAEAAKGIQVFGDPVTDTAAKEQGAERAAQQEAEATTDINLSYRFSDGQDIHENMFDLKNEPEAPETRSYTSPRVSTVYRNMDEYMNAPEPVPNRVDLETGEVIQPATQAEVPPETLMEGIPGAYDGAISLSTDTDDHGMPFINVGSPAAATAAIGGARAVAAGAMGEAGSIAGAAAGIAGTQQLDPASEMPDERLVALNSLFKGVANRQNIDAADDAGKVVEEYASGMASDRAGDRLAAEAAPDEDGEANNKNNDELSFTVEYSSDNKGTAAELGSVKDEEPSGDEQVSLATNVTKTVNRVFSAMSEPKKEAAPELPPYTMPNVKYILSKSTRQFDERLQAEIAENAKVLQQTLNDFKVRAEIKNACHGPAVTRYEVKPAPGVKVSKITSLSDDIALNMAATAVRIEQIPGKPAIGIEIPNKTLESVQLREVLEHPNFAAAKSKLTVGLGKDISGQAIFADLTKMPHLLVAGATGSGKSVCINTLIASILFKARPEEVKFILIDPKMVELSVYNDIPHLMVPVVTDARKAAAVLNWAVQEMEKRYGKIAEVGVRNAEGYNRFYSDDPTKQMSSIVIIIDELADLMMVASHEVEDSICRLAQKARAAGIYMVLATQRPSVNVITGVIKANIPSRISFAVTSQIDSRTILDTAGAEKLLGRGDMLFMPQGTNKPTRIQGAFVSDHEVEELVEFIKKQGHKAEANQEIIEFTNKALAEGDEESGPVTTTLTKVDPLLREAVELVMTSQNASVSSIQRRYRIGYTRAGRLIDTMEELGIVGPNIGSKPREILVTPEQAFEIMDGVEL